MTLEPPFIPYDLAVHGLAVHDLAVSDDPYSACEGLRAGRLVGVAEFIGG